MRTKLPITEPVIEHSDRYDLAKWMDELEKRMDELERRFAVVKGLFQERGGHDDD